MVSYSKISVKMHERVKWPKTSALPPIQSMDDIYEAMEAMGIDADCDLTMYRIGEGEVPQFLSQNVFHEFNAEMVENAFVVVTQLPDGFMPTIMETLIRKESKPQLVMFGDHSCGIATLIEVIGIAYRSSIRDTA